MEKLKAASIAVVFFIFITPVISQHNPNGASNLGQFLSGMTSEQKLRLLDFMRAQITPDPMDEEALVLFKKMAAEGQQSTINWIFKTQIEAGHPIRTKVKLNRDTLDFGTLLRGDTKRDSIIVYNEGDQPYIISETVANCGCTIPDSPNWPIMPGDSAVVHISFNSRNLLPGEIRRAVSIRDNSTPNLRNLIWINARIVSSDAPPVKKRH